MSEIDQQLSTLASELVGKTERMNRPLLLPATVSTYDAAARIAYVTVDGDEGQVSTAAVSLIGPMSTGERVMVQFEPPQGVFVIGSLSGRGGTVLGYMQHSSAHTGIANGAIIDSAYSVTVTVPAGRLIEITVLMPAAAGEDVDSGWETYLKQDGADLKAIATCKTITRYADLGRFNMNGTVLHDPSAGEHTYQVYAGRFAGTGNFAVDASSRVINQIVVKDVGTA